MRTYEPIVPFKEMDRREYELWRKVDEWNRQVAAAIGALSRNVSPDQSQTPPETPPLIDDHGLLDGLVPVLNPDGSVADYNDDHTQYPLIFGRPGGQYLYGSRVGETTTWQPAGTFLLAASPTGAGGTTSWGSIQADANAPVNTGIILALSSFSANNLAAGETNYHTTMTDTGGNTWTKLKEYTYNYGGGGAGSTATHVSLWFCLVTSALTATTSTITANFSTIDHTRSAIEAYSFTMAAGLSVTLVSYLTDGSTVAMPAAATSMSIGAISGQTLFVRALGVVPLSGSQEPAFTPTTGFMAFASVHTDSTNTGIGPSSARAEFVIRTNDGAASAPHFVPLGGDDYRSASVFGAIQISGSAAGSLTLGAANISDASKIFLENRDIRFAAGLNSGKFKFDPLGSPGFVGILDFDLVSGSDKTYTFPNTTGTIALTSDLAAYLKLDASNDPLTGTLDTQIIRPSADNTYDIGDSGRFYKDLYLSSDIIPKTDSVMDIGTTAIGINKEHYAYPTTNAGTVRGANTKGMLWEDNSLGDVFVGADNVFGYAGYYSQRCTRANSSATGNSEDATNLYQGAWGSGATPTYPFLELNWNVGSGATGLYTTGGFAAADVAVIRNGAVTIGIYETGNAMGGGGLLLGSRGGTASNVGCGAYLHFDEANTRFIIRTMSSNSGMAAGRISQVAFGGVALTSVVPVTTNAVDLGATGNTWKSLFISGALTHTGTTAGFFSAAAVGQQAAATDLGTALSNLGLRVAGTAYPITTSAAVSFTGTIGLGGQVTVSDAINFALNATTGTKIGTATTQKLGFWNAAPIVQPATGGAASTFVANTSSTVDDSATWDGYTIGNVVKALRNAGLLA